MKDLRSISLCNVLYKLVSKVPTNRLKSCLGKLVSKSQSAFVPGRLIKDNVLAAFEIFHHTKTMRGGLKEFLALKLDMAKAYDHRGLRQGILLSPYLFLLCVEGLSGLLRVFERENHLQGISIARNAPSVSHLFFVDDCVHFARATCQQSSEIIPILHAYGAASGQQVNFSKSELSFSKNVSREKRAEVQQILNVREVEKHEKYLGLPTTIGQRKSFLGKLKIGLHKNWDWKAKSLSRAGKEVLIKSVVQAIPTCAMSCFAFPDSLCIEIEQLMSKFWWVNGDKGSDHWMRWKHLCVLKSSGGLGFRNMTNLNIALLARQRWRLIREPSSLIAQILNAKYHPHTEFLEAEMGKYPSYIWRSLLRGREVLKQGLLWSVGNGASINIWKDELIPRPLSFKIISTPSRVADPELRFIDLIDWSRGDWRVDLFHITFFLRESWHTMMSWCLESKSDGSFLEEDVEDQNCSKGTFFLAKTNSFKVKLFLILAATFVGNPSHVSMCFSNVHLCRKFESLFLHWLMWMSPSGRVLKGEVCGIGFIARVQTTVEVEFVEAEALLWEMEVSIEQQVTHVIFESDCSSLVSKLRKPSA
ncbi:LOW QUALITY PROTEIN: hypothetical protein V2J09_009226 [Rumex salicifolius]